MERALTNNSKMLCFSFNQDSSCFCIGTERGFIIYKSSPLNDYYIRELNGGIGLITMFNNSNLVGLVGGGKRPYSALNKLVIWNDATSKPIFEITVDFKIKNIKVKNSLIAIVGKKKIKIYYYNSLEDIMSYKDIDTIVTPENRNGVFSMNLEPKKHIIAYPTKNIGEIMIKTYFKKKNNIDESEEEKIISKSQNIPAHQSEVTVMALNPQGDILASVSQKGSLIRLFDTSTGETLRGLRRGTDSAEIYSINFDKTSQYVLVTSSKGTVHIFNIGQSKVVKNPKSFLSSLAPYLNLQNSYLDNEWSFAQYHTKCKNNNIANFYGKNNDIVVLTEDGMYYRAKFNYKGGECITLQEKSFLGMENKDDDFYYDDDELIDE